MDAAEGLASEVEAALRKAHKYTDAAGGQLTAAVAGNKRKHKTGSSSKPAVHRHDHQQSCRPNYLSKLMVDPYSVPFLPAAGTY